LEDYQVGLRSTTLLEEIRKVVEAISLLRTV